MRVKIGGEQGRGSDWDVTASMAEPAADLFDYRPG